MTGEEGYFDTRIIYVAESRPKDRRIKKLAIMDQDGANNKFLTLGNELVLTPRFNPNSQLVTYMSYFPQERDMFIFPAWLKHWVSPFHSDCTRISVSGNIHDSAPLNNITKFGPEYVKDKKDDSKT